MTATKLRRPPRRVLRFPALRLFVSARGILPMLALFAALFAGFESQTAQAQTLNGPLPNTTFTIGQSVSVTFPDGMGGGGPPHSYEIQPPDLPAGLSFDETTRVLSGTPTGPAGSFSYVYFVSDQFDNSAGHQFTIVINASTPVAVTINSPIAGDDIVNGTEWAAGFSITGTTEAGAAVTVTLDGGSPRTATVDGTTWSLAIGTRDAGIFAAGTRIDIVATAAISGRTSGTASHEFAADFDAPSAGWTAPATLIVGVAITAISPSPRSIDIASFAVLNGTLPAGLNLNATSGEISGTPSAANAGTAEVTIRVSDNAGNIRDLNVTFPAVGKGTQTLTGFAYSAAAAMVGGAVPTVTAPSGAVSGSTLSYTTNDNAICTANANTGALTLVGAGSCVVTVTAAETANYNAATATFTIAVSVSPTIGFPVMNYNVDESLGSFEICVVASEAASAEAVVEYALTAGTATENADYRPPSGMSIIRIPSGMTEGCVDIGIVDDADVEPDESFSARILSVPPAFLLGRTNANINIVANDAGLSGLTLSGGTVLTPDFATGTTSYTASVANSVASLTVTPMAIAGASITVNGDTVASGTASGAVPLSVGANTITIAVSLPSIVQPTSTNMATYTVTVTRAAAMAISGDTAGAVTEDAASPNNAASGTLTVSGLASANVVAQTDAAGTYGTFTVTVAGVWTYTLDNADTDTNGLAAGAVMMDAFTVVAADDSTVTATVTITVTGANDAPAAVAGDDQAVTVGDVVTLDGRGSSDPDSGDSVESYVWAQSGVPAVTLSGATTAQATFTPVTAGAYTFTLTVSDGDLTDTDEVTVTVDPAPSADATLSGLTISPGSLTPTFDPGTTSYAASVDASVATVTVTPAATDDDASLAVTANDATVAVQGGAYPAPVTVGANTIEITVTAEDGTTTEIYTVTVTRAEPAATDATLSGLTISPGSLTPTFDPGTTSYAASVDASVATVTVTPAATDDDASLAVTANDATVAVQGGAYPAPVTVGANVIEITVTAEDGTTTETYTVTVTRAEPASTDATLSGLTISPGSLTPVFDPGATSYAASVDASVAIVTVTPAAADDGASLAVTANDATVAVQGGAYPAPVTVGANAIEITVTAEDGTTTETYTVTVTRAEPASTDATLSGLTISPGSLSPAFDPGTTSYTASVANDVASITVMPSAVDTAGASITVNGDMVASGSASNPISLAIGANAIEIDVTAEDGTTMRRYVLAVTRAGGLSGLTLSEGGALSLTPGVLEYAVSVGRDVASLTVTPTGASGATITVNGAEIGSDAPSVAIDLTADTTTITIFVMAATEETYTLTVTRGSGGEAAARINDSVLPQVSQAMVSSVVSAIIGRIDAAASGAAASPASALSGTTNILAALKSAESLQKSEALDFERVLGELSFLTSLNAAAGDAADATGTIAVWGGGDYGGLSGPDSGPVDWDGDVFGIVLGADIRVRPDLLTGLSVSRHSGSFDYTDRAGAASVRGEIKTRMTSVQPYVSWMPSQGRSLWAAVGYGAGEIEIKEDDGARGTSDTTLKMAAAGGSRELLSGGRAVSGATATLRIKARGSLARTTVEGGNVDAMPIPADGFNTRSLRLAVEGGLECLGGGSGGGCVTPSLEVAGRYDGGDGRTGTGLEVGGGLEFARGGVTASLRGRALVVDSDGYEDWGVGGRVRIDPGADRLGLSLRIEPGFGDASNRAGRVYEQDPSGLSAGRAANPAARLESELGYGVSRLSGVVTPYIGLSIEEGASRAYRAGGRFEIGSRFSLGLEGKREERGSDGPNHQAMITGRLRW